MNSRAHSHTETAAKTSSQLHETPTHRLPTIFGWLLRIGGTAGLLLLLAAAVTLAPPAQAQTQVVFAQAPSASGGLIASSWVDPNGSDSDMYVYDNFTLASDAAITEIDWRGGYIYNAMYGAATNFSVTFFDSIAGGSQPHVGNPQLEDTNPIYLVKYWVGGNAGETLAGTFGGSTMYDYRFVLPAPFQALAGTKYWVRIEASQGVYPDWGIAAGTGGEGQHFRFSTGAAMFSFAPGDVAFTLLTAAGPTYTIATSASPSNGGTASGGGAYPAGSAAVVVATANPGFGFVSWTENGATVSTSATYTFTASANRTLVANFTAAYTIATSSVPGNGGSTSGGGAYASGSAVTVVATPSPGYVFVNWMEAGVSVSSSASYSFTANADRTLVANFTLNSTSATFDFDTGTPPLVPYQGMPSAQTSGGITASFSAPSGAWSIQSDATTQFHLSQFSGNYLYPNVASSSVEILFSQQLSSIAFTFCTADFHQVEIPTTLQLTAYENSTASPPVGTTTAHGTYGNDTMPMGSLIFGSAAPFNLVRIEIPYAPLAAADFLVDNITVTPIQTAEDTGLVPPDKNTATCEDTASRKLATFGRCVTNCQIKQADAALKGTFFDEEACEQAVGKRPRSCREAYDSALSKLLSRQPPICPSCLDTAALGNLADLITNFVDTSNGQIYCSGAVGFGGDDAGFVPPDKNTAMCEDTAARRLRTLVLCVTKCHVKHADTALKGQPFNEEACELSCRATYDKASAALLGRKPVICPPCLNATALGSLADLLAKLLDTNNGEIYCAGTTPLP